MLEPAVTTGIPTEDEEVLVERTPERAPASQRCFVASSDRDCRLVQETGTRRASRYKASLRTATEPADVSYVGMPPLASEAGMDVGCTIDDLARFSPGDIWCQW